MEENIILHPDLMICHTGVDSNTNICPGEETQNYCLGGGWGGTPNPFSAGGVYLFNGIAHSEAASDCPCPLGLAIVDRTPALTESGQLH